VSELHSNAFKKEPRQTLAVNCRNAGWCNQSLSKLPQIYNTTQQKVNHHHHQEKPNQIHSHYLPSKLSSLSTNLPHSPEDS
jgi:hypothetical protein